MLNKYFSMANGDVLNIVVHQNIRLLYVIVPDILDSDHLLIIFHILDHLITKESNKTTWKTYRLEKVPEPSLKINIT
jgi:hypothetical protein